MAEKPAKDSKFGKFKYMHTNMTPSLLGFIIAKFQDMERFKYFMISAIENEKKFIRECHKEDTNGMSGEELTYYSDMVADEFFLVDDFFTEVSFYSFTMSIYSYVESSLNTLCRFKYSDKVHRQKKDNLRAKDEGGEQKPLLKIKLKDFAGEGIIKTARKYLEKVFYVDFSSVKEEWDELNGLRKIRNAIVHNNGKAGDAVNKDGKIRQNIDNGRIEIQDNGKIIVKQEYTGHILDQAISFFKNIDI